MSNPTPAPDPTATEDLLAALAEEFLRRHRTGEAVSPDEYITKYPGLADRIREIFSAMLLMEHDAPPSVERPGTIIGRYKLLERIGEGGFGVVYMAEQQHPVRRRVALKLLKPGMDTRQVLARFDAERQALAIMDHPNIAQVFDGGMTDSGRPYFVMELVKGSPITDFCDQQQLEPRQRLELFALVCHAVQHAHQKGIIHRDIKPSNVLVVMHDTTPVVKVIDFGVAKALGQELTDKTLFTGFAQLVGTPLYMSPEQAGQSALDVDTRSDIYSLGVLLYELLTGTTPFDKERFKRAAQDEIRRIIREEEPPRPSTRLSASKDSLPSISAQRHTEPAKLTRLLRGDLDWIVMKALEKDRSRRYETVNGFAMDVQRYLADEPVIAGPPSRVYRFRKFVRRNKATVTAAGAVLFCLVAGVVATSAGLAWAVRERDDKARALVAERRARDAERQARDQAMNALRSLTDDIVENQMARGVQLTDENKAFLREIIKRFEGFAAITADDAQSRAIRAEGYLRVGRMRHRLGEVKEAEKSYNDALALWKQLAVEFPNQPEFREQLAHTIGNRSRIYVETGRLQDAEAALGEAIVLWKKLSADLPARPDLRQQLASAQNNLGALFQMTGRIKDAESTYREVVAIRQGLVAEVPSQPEYRHSLGLNHNNLGYVLQSTGRPEEAEASYADALAVQKPLVADFPARPAYRQELASTYNNLAILLRSTGRIREAESAYQEAVALRRQLAADFSTRPEFRHDLANSVNNLGVMFKTTGRPSEAEAAYGEALEIWKKLATELPTRSEFRVGLARAHGNLAVLFQLAGRFAEADAAYTAALAVRRQLVDESPNRDEWLADLAMTLTNKAELRLGQRDFKAALTALAEAAVLLESALKANPRRPSYQESYRSTLSAVVQANAGLGDREAAMHAADRLRDLAWNPPADAYAAAVALALCVPLVRQRDQDPGDQHVSVYGEAAVRMLRDSVARGLSDTGQIARDANLESLRGREDFEKLAAALKAQSSSTRPSP